MRAWILEILGLICEYSRATRELEAELHVVARKRHDAEVGMRIER